MARFRRVPQEVGAEQFWPPEQQDGATPLPGVRYHQSCPAGAGAAACWLDGKHYVETANGAVTLNPGDWVIEEPDGSGYYPCRKDIFERTYAPMEER